MIIKTYRALSAQTFQYNKKKYKKKILNTHTNTHTILRLTLFWPNALQINFYYLFARLSYLSVNSPVDEFLLYSERSPKSLSLSLIRCSVYIFLSRRIRTLIVVCFLFSDVSMTFRRRRRFYAN